MKYPKNYHTEDSYIYDLGTGRGFGEHVWESFITASSSNSNIRFNHHCTRCGLRIQTYLNSLIKALDNLSLPHRCEEMAVPIVMAL